MLSSIFIRRSEEEVGGVRDPVERDHQGAGCEFDMKEVIYIKSVSSLGKRLRVRLSMDPAGRVSG